MNLKLEFATYVIFLFINIHAPRKCLFAACNKECNQNFFCYILRYLPVSREIYDLRNL